MAAPILLQLGIPVIAEILSEALGTIDHPAAKAASKSLGHVGQALTAGQITPEQMAEANRHAEKMAELTARENVAAYQEVNESLRAEVASDDAYVRRMRPTFGYLMAITWAAQMLALAWVIVFDTAQARIVLEAMESLGTIWMVGLSVLGIYVYKRSEEKKTGAFPAFQGADAEDAPVLRGGRRAMTATPEKNPNAQAYQLNE